MDKEIMQKISKSFEKLVGFICEHEAESETNETVKSVHTQIKTLRESISDLIEKKNELGLEEDEFKAKLSVIAMMLSAVKDVVDKELLIDYDDESEED